MAANMSSLDPYTLIGIIFALMSLGSAWMFIATRYHYLVKIVAISLVVAGTIFCWSSVYALIGFSIQGYPEDGSVVLAFNPDKPHDVIDMWVRDKIAGKARGYVFPYDDKLLKALKEGSEKAKKGNLVMKFYRHPPKGTDGDGAGGKGQGQGGKEGDSKGKQGQGGKPGKGGKGERNSDEQSIFGDDIGPGFDIRLTPGLPSKDGNENNDGAEIIHG